MSMTHGNGVVTSYTYDAASQLTRLAHQLGATTINSFDYTYDNVGNRKTRVDRNGGHNYTYDTLNRLTEALNPLPSNPLESFNYHAVGNRTNSNQNGASVFNQANQLLEDGGFTYQYDNNGNLTRKTPKIPGPFNSYEYDAENKLVRAVINGTTANYKYDGLGRRVEKEVISVGTTVTRYVYDNEDILLELDGSNNIVARYMHGPGIDEPLIMEKGGQSFFYHADGLGSITDVTNPVGGIEQRYAYSSFGDIESQLDPNIIQPYTYTARELDPETGLYFYRARLYDAFAGRFMQNDPIGNKGMETNVYLYVGNNPIRFVDPVGLLKGEWRGAPEHLVDPDTGERVPLKCRAGDACPEIKEKMDALERTIIGHVMWVRLNPGRNDHVEEIAGLTRALNLCVQLYVKKDCDKCPEMKKLYGKQLQRAPGVVPGMLTIILLRKLYQELYQ
jgi:RHS repeat-associated protein